MMLARDVGDDVMPGIHEHERVIAAILDRRDRQDLRLLREIEKRDDVQDIKVRRDIDLILGSGRITVLEERIDRSAILQDKVPLFQDHAPAAVEPEIGLPTEVISVLLGKLDGRIGFHIAEFGNRRIAHAGGCSTNACADSAILRNKDGGQHARDDQDDADHYAGQDTLQFQPPCFCSLRDEV